MITRLDCKIYALGRFRVRLGLYENLVYIRRFSNVLEAFMIFEQLLAAEDMRFEDNGLELFAASTTFHL